MSSALKVDIQGMKSLERNLRKLDKVYGHNDRKMQDIMYGAAKITKRNVLRFTPEGPTGTLRRSIKAMKPPINRKYNPAAFAAVDRVIAPHAYNVEFGIPAYDQPGVHYFKNGVLSSLFPVRNHIRMHAKRKFMQKVRGLRK
jgi:hypothetical protein